VKKGYGSFFWEIYMIDVIKCKLIGENIEDRPYTPQGFWYGRRTISTMSCHFGRENGRGGAKASK
jgi:hypothetical protein